MNLILRLDADQTVGFGHAVRTAALVAALDPACVTVFGRASPGLFTLLPGARLEPVDADLLICARRIAALAPDLLICDLTDAPAPLWPALRQFVDAPVVAVDDYGGAIEADLIVNGTVLPDYHHYPAASPSTELLCGGAYTLLRAPFGHRRWRDPQNPRVTLVLGSGMKAACWLERLLDGGFFRDIAASIEVIVGWGFARPELLERVRPVSAGIHRGLDAAALARHLAQSSVVLCTGGMIVYETLAVGTPAVVLPQEDNLVQETRWFAARGVVAGLDPTGGGEPAQAIAEVGILLADAARREEQSRRGSALIDGQGVARVATTIRRSLLRAAA